MAPTADRARSAGSCRGMLCIRCARMKPINALNTTEVMANRQLWKMTSWKVWRFSKNWKLPRPTKAVIFLFSMLK